MKVRPTALALRFVRPIPYPLLSAAMERLVDERITDRIPDLVLFLEHEPVITLGNRGREDSLLIPRNELERRGIPVVHASRGGDVTFHGPGQLVIYPICKLGPSEADARSWLFNLEEAGLRLCAELKIPAWRIPGQTGVWTNKGKLIAIGVRFRRWVAYHGMSLNVNVKLDFTRWIIPCGLVGKPVTTLRSLLGSQCPSLDEVAHRILPHLANAIGRHLLWTSHVPGTDALNPVADWITCQTSTPRPVQNGDK